MPLVLVIWLNSSLNFYHNSSSWLLLLGNYPYYYINLFQINRYMDFLIIRKWCTNWDGRLDEAPGIINSMINMPLKGGSTEGMPLYDVET